jgi:hypothetical protein
MLEETSLFYAFLALSQKKLATLPWIFYGSISNCITYASVQYLTDGQPQLKA